MERKIAVFGASGAGKKVADSFKSMGIKFELFLDNDSKKWGTIFCEKRIENPKIVLKNDMEIVIASDYYEEIYEQLLEMGIEKNRIVAKEKYLLENIEKVLVSKKEIDKTPIVYMDLAEGMQLGGIETWVVNVCRLLKKNGYNIKILSSGDITDFPNDIQDIVEILEISYINYKESTQNIYNTLNDNSIMICNWMTQAFMAAYYQKYIDKRDIKIIGMVHHDMKGFYMRNQYLSQYIDRFVCVSNDTCKKMINEYGIESKKVMYHPVPIDVPRYTEKSKEIVLAYAGRLVKSQKRLDRVIELLDELEKRKIEYTMNIAGEGPYKEKIFEYITKNNIQDRVILYGNLNEDEMKVFWKKSNIVLSVSDSEGMGLSILEGMANGLIPIVTDTAGIRMYVDDNKNGFICKRGDISSIVEKLLFLSQNKDKIGEMSLLCVEKIKNINNRSGYIDLLVEV